MAKKRVYIESSVISYLTAWPSRDLITLARQHLTREWWARREGWEFFVSPAVLEEIADGDPLAAAERLVVVRELPVLSDHPKARAMAGKLATEIPIPDKAQADAAHLALAAFHGMDYLATWNQTHLDNPHLREKIRETIRAQGFSPALVLTPERLLEVNDD
ncbi:MAG: DNA-binding protein [Phycisphaerae bacterium]|nr:DNA-binding protein [Phycisphaerae bacterium]